MSELQSELRRNQAEYYQRIKEQYLNNKVSPNIVKSKNRKDSPSEKKKEDQTNGTSNTKTKEKKVEKKQTTTAYSAHLGQRSMTWLNDKVNTLYEEVSYINEDIFKTNSKMMEEEVETNDIINPTKLPSFLKKIFLWVILFLEMDMINLSDNIPETSLNNNKEENGSSNKSINKFFNKVYDFNIHVFNDLKNKFLQLISFLFGNFLIYYNHLE